MSAGNDAPDRAGGRPSRPSPEILLLTPGNPPALSCGAASALLHLLIRAHSDRMSPEISTAASGYPQILRESA
jgi:hypothetical protein